MSGRSGGSILRPKDDGGGSKCIVSPAGVLLQKHKPFMIAAKFSSLHQPVN